MQRKGETIGTDSEKLRRRRLADGRNAWRKMDPDQRREFVAWLGDDGLWPLVADELRAHEGPPLSPEVAKLVLRAGVARSDKLATACDCRASDPRPQVPNLPHASDCPAARPGSLAAEIHAQCDEGDKLLERSRATAQAMRQDDPRRAENVRPRAGGPDDLYDRGAPRQGEQ